MTTIYISSTYKDLKKERKAADQAIRRLGHMTLCMEDYVATEKRPVDKCLQDVRGCDIYVGIFAFRYGFIPKNFNKSITHLEYEAAKEAGIPCLIFLLHKDADWKPSKIDTGDNRKRIDDLRSQLMNDYNLSFFDNADQLGGLVSAAVSNLIKKEPGVPIGPSEPEPENKPKLGPIVSKMCNRYLQEISFKHFFEEKSEQFPGKPQFYFIHGDDYEGHDCFLKRMEKTYLKDCAAKMCGQEYASICSKDVPWLQEGTLSTRQIHLKYKLVHEFNNSHDISGLDANKLSLLPCFNKQAMVLIQHNILSSKWDNITQQLIDWYINDFWVCLEGEDIPIFLVFFNVIYFKKKETGFMSNLLKKKSISKKLIKEKLEYFSKNSHKECPCLVLDELMQIGKEDVSLWIKHYNIVKHEWDRKKIIESIFGQGDEKVESLCWAEVEKKLSRIINNVGISGRNYQYERIKS